jgi:superfamily I DNA and RNA helicase
MSTRASYPLLQRAIQAAQIKVVGEQDVHDAAHAHCMAAILQAYGASEQGFLYAEPVLATSDVAPDLVLAHPQTGVIVFEVKAYDLDFILGIEAGSLKIRRNGSESLVNPLKQAQRGMYAIKEQFEQLALDSLRPLFNVMIALPNIREEDWIKAGYEACIQRRLILFAEDCNDPERLKARVARHVHHTLSLSGLSEPLPPSTIEVLLRAFGHSGVLNRAKRTVRKLPFDNLGAEIDRLQNAQKQLSLEQQELSRLDTWGHPYLVRGVAGSGKSIVLAYQVAWAILRHERRYQQLTLFPEDRHHMPKIAVVCLQRTLVPLLQEMIQTAYRDIAGKSLPAEYVTVAHLNGLIYQLAEEHDHFHYVPMTRSKDTGERSRAYLAQLDSMTPAELDELRFDAMFIDEGQDVHPDTLTLLYTLIRPDSQTTERTLSIYYDDAQNIYGHPRPIWRTFGLNVEGGRAAFMKQCYRNSREIVELGLNVLLGTAADENTRVQTRRYADIYTLKEKNLVQETPDGWRVSFAEPSGENPQVHIFPNRTEQVEWIADVLLSLIEEEQVRPEDILVLTGTTGTFPHLETRLRTLSEGRIEPRLVGGNNRSTMDEVLLVTGKLTISTIHAAKGYDVPLVILMDVDQLPSSVTGRALFYVGATRAKRYLVITGVKTPDSLLSEAQMIHRRLFAE